ncbi:hypothetical protein L915_08416 [Phytophthora nicotianae]|uniref:Tc3 transposase DNA binding domain-containing protein n=1 Tax=Phytophthora nicotianae TaxID=4792 RepID=W2GW03_PHYNI|nr:hypothetical protein L915_08416 [Phytophthora nicotianae]
MGHGKALSEQEHWFIVGLHCRGVSLHEIARKTGRSRTSVRNAFKAERGDRKKTALVRAAATGEFFTAELKTKLGIKASVRTIQRVLQSVDHLVYTKTDRTLPLTAAHKVARILKPGKLVI